MKTEAPEMDKKYEAECDLRTMVSAAEISADPARMKAVSELAGKQKKAVSTVSDLIARREELNRAEEDDSEDEAPAKTKMVKSEGPVKKE